MSYLYLASRRQRRRLPHVQRPPRSKPVTFWPTYRGAVEWLRHNHGVIDKALGLLEIYPSLIQDTSLDSLWDFIAPFFTKVERNGAKATRTNQVTLRHRSSGRNASPPRSTTSRASAHSNSIGGTSTKSNTNIGKAVSNGASNTNGALHVPVISITYASDDHDAELQALSPSPTRVAESMPFNHTPRIFLSCLCNHHTGEEKLHRQVLHALQHDFFVRSGPCAEDKHDTDWDDISQADVCVFVLDDPSLNTPACFKSLCAAWTFDIPVVFLKDSNYSLPTRLPDVILQHNLGLENPDVSRASTPVGPARSPTPEMHKYSPNRASSATELRHQKCRRRTQQDLRDSDMVLYLLNGYRNAMVFEESRQQHCQEELKNIIQRLLGASNHEMIFKYGKSESMPRNPNILHPMSKRPGSSRRSHKTFLGVPKVLPRTPIQQNTEVINLFADDNDDDDNFMFSRYPSEGSVNSPPPSFSDVSSSENLLSPWPSSQSIGDTASPKNLHPPSAVNSHHVVSAPSLHSVQPTGAQSSNRCESSRSLGSLHQFQRQLQQDRTAFLSNTTSTDDVNVWDDFNGRQTTYLVCSKSKLSPNREPRLVKWPPSNEDKDGEANEVLSDTVSDSPVSFRDLDLSMVVNKPRRGSDTPDSDASTAF